VKIQRIGVVGMGTMGSQIGIACARGGFQTIMVDVSEQHIETGLNSIRHFLSNQVNKGKIGKGDEWAVCSVPEDL